MMGLLKKAEITLAFAKIGILGFQGAGKSYTAWLIALGLAKMTGNNKVEYIDSETGSDFFIPWAKKEGIDLYQTKTRSFVDLKKAIEESEKEKIGVIISDSMTHFWKDLMESYKIKLKRDRLQFQDWDIVKREWSTYTDIFVNSAIHIIACGRAGFEYDYDYNEDGSKDLIKVGTRMKVESEFGFEPHLVIEMERTTKTKKDLEEIHKIPEIKKRREKKEALSIKIGSEWIHRAHVLKDRTDSINGKIFDNPNFESFLPHFQKINIGGKHFGVETQTQTQELFSIEGKPDWKIKQEQKEIAIAEFFAELDKKFPSPTSPPQKRARLILGDHIFGVKTKEAINILDGEIIKSGLEYLKFLVSKDWVIKAIIEEEEPQQTLISAREEWEKINQ